MLSSAAPWTNSTIAPQLVREADRDRFIATLFAPAEQRDALFALYAFNVEIARVRELAREPMPGEIRLQWWREVIAGLRSGEAAANPVAAALLSYYRAPSAFAGPADRHDRCARFDLYDEPMATSPSSKPTPGKRHRRCSRWRRKSSPAPKRDASCAPAGVAYAVTGLLRALPLHIARRQLYLPAALLDDITAPVSTTCLPAAPRQA